jgi:hypothetical protein
MSEREGIPRPDFDIGRCNNCVIASSGVSKVERTTERTNSSKSLKHFPEIARVLRR